ncbi:hypothetical protein B0J14DRAFT_189130 [Halenospora varia]|nr:hypothetical protein B0J14DRAFT_189130 [Halenospora varia]
MNFQRLGGNAPRAPFNTQRFLKKSIRNLFQFSQTVTEAMHRKIWTSVALYIFISTCISANTESITVTAEPDFGNLRDCAKGCFDAGYLGNIFSDLSCSKNNCLCRNDLLSGSHSAITSCIVTTGVQPRMLSMSAWVSRYMMVTVPNTEGPVATVTAASQDTPQASSPKATITNNQAASTVTVSQGSDTITINQATTITTSSKATATVKVLSSSTTLLSTTSSSTSSIRPVIAPTSSLSSDTSSLSSTLPPIATASNSAFDPGKEKGGLGRANILTIVIEILGAIVAIGVDLWQSRRQSALRRRVRDWRSNVELQSNSQH